MSAIKAILWDVGGTLVDDRYTMAESIRTRMSMAGVQLDFLSDQQIETAFGKFFEMEDAWVTLEQERRDVELFFRGLLAPAGLSEAQFRDVLARLPDYYDVHKPVEGIAGLLGELRSRGLKQAVVSNWPPSLKGFLDHHRLTPFFDVLVFSGQDGIKKPDRRIYGRALTALGVSAGEALFIGDHRHLDVDPPVAMGMRAIHFDPRRKHPVADARTVPELRAIIWKMLGDG